MYVSTGIKLNYTLCYGIVFLTSSLLVNLLDLQVMYGQLHSVWFYFGINNASASFEFPVSKLRVMALTTPGWSVNVVPVTLFLKFLILRLLNYLESAKGSRSPLYLTSTNITLLKLSTSHDIHVRLRVKSQ